MRINELHKLHARHLRALRRSEETVRFYQQAATALERHLAATGREDDAGAVTRADLMELQEAMAARGLLPGAVHAFFRGLRAMFKWAVEEELISRDPTAKLKLPTNNAPPPPAIQPEEVKLCLVVAKKMPFPARNAAILYLLYDTGLRMGELLGLRTGDVDMTQGVLRVNPEESKTGSSRIVPLGIKSSKALARYERTERKPALPHVDALMIARGGAPLTKSGLSQLMNRIAEAAELPRDHVAPHAWRRGFAVEYLRNGGDLFTLQQILGHASLAQTRRYVSYLPTDIQRQHLRASPGDRL